jgi:hypothetical protein
LSSLITLPSQFLHGISEVLLLRPGEGLLLNFILFPAQAAGRLKLFVAQLLFIYLIVSLNAKAFLDRKSLQKGQDLFSSFIIAFYRYR